MGMTIRQRWRWRSWCRGASRKGDSDIISKGTISINCGWKILREPPIVIDDELDVMGARYKRDSCGKGVWIG